MPGLREAALAGAALALTGGVAYVIWKLRDTKQNREAEKVTLKQNLNAEKQEKLVEKEIRTETAREAPTVSQRQTRGSQVLVLGLDGAGKTSLLQCFVTGSTEQEVSPTQGFHAVSINREELHIEFLEIGGEEKFRDYWPMYLKKARVLVFVLDSSNSTRFPLAKTSLHRLLAAELYLPLVLLANKQDLPGACGVTELYESMALGSVGDGRKLCVLGTQVRKGHFSSTPSPRILQLARPRESKTVWLTTPQKVTWGNQETIWSPSRTALIAVPTTRILALSQPKKDLSALSQDLQRKKHEGIEEAKKRSACVPSSTAQYEHVARLATPNVRHRSSQAVSPPHTKQCEHNCPVWHISPVVQNAVASPRILQLAQPRNTHPEYKSNRQVETCISCAAKSAQASPRLEQLCVPKVRESKLFYQLGHPESTIRPVSKGARKATASARVRELSIPKSYIPP